MKRIVWIVVLLHVFLLLSTFSYATNKTYTIPELDIKVSLPDEDVVLFQNNPDNHPYLSEYGYDQAAIEQRFRQNDIYLNCLAADGTYEIIITKIDNSNQKASSFSDFDDATLKQLARDLVEEAKKMNILDISDYFIDRSGNVPFIVMDHSHSENGLILYSRQYCTWYNNATVNITLHSMLGKVTNEQKTIIKEIAAGAEFPQVSGTNSSFSDGMISSSVSGALSGVIQSALAMALVGGAYAIFTVKKPRNKKGNPIISTQSSDTVSSLTSPSPEDHIETASGISEFSPTTEALTSSSVSEEKTIASTDIEEKPSKSPNEPSTTIAPTKVIKKEKGRISGIGKTVIYCCKACGCVIKKGTRVCPHCGAYIGPNKVRNARILAGVCAVLLCISLAGNFGLSLYVWELNNKAENDLAELKAENETLLTNRDILRTLLDSWKNKYREASEENWKLQSELEIFNSVTDGYDDLMAKYNEAVAYSEQLALEISAYRDTVALMNEYNTSYQYYHSIFCPKLHQSSFYVLSTDYARNTMHCSPCPDCH